MTPLTSVDKAAVQASSDRLGSMIGQLPAFDALHEPVPDLGSIPEAQWLKDLVSHRNQAITEHVGAWDEDFAQTTTMLRRAADGMIEEDENARQWMSSGAGRPWGASSVGEVPGAGGAGAHDG